MQHPNPPHAVPCLFMRGGTSKGPFFNERDLPADIAKRNQVLLAIMGSPDKRQIDGLGGAHPLTSKLGIVRPGNVPGVDLEFLFAQLQPDHDMVDTTPNCGNMLAAVVPYALESGMLHATSDTTTLRVLTLNTNMQCDITVQTPLGPNGQRFVADTGEARIDGVPGTSAPIQIQFLNTAGSVCGKLLPTGQVKDHVKVLPTDSHNGFEPFGLEVTCIDNGMPLVLFKASDMGVSGYESAEALNANAELKTRIEATRLQVSVLMGLGDVSQKNYPKMTMIAPPKQGGTLTTRSFIPHVCHDAIGVLAAVTVGTAGVLRGSVCDGVALMPIGVRQTLSIEHPTGEFSVALQTREAPDLPGGHEVMQAALLRTARLLMRGQAMVPAHIWNSGDKK
ncbi:MAG: 4-oxalomesaconate tautomerase [Betaproteobacteria bacterium]|nr:4-oxalomesaconate tautomerase [Betaproteobacteria bacterium]